MHQNNRIKHLCKQKQHDKYYTKPIVVQRCLDLLYSANLHNYDFAIDPSAGSGVFYYAILDLYPDIKKIAMDLYPDFSSSEIMTQDWLQYEIPNIYKSVLVMGNPPFGQYNKLSTQFLQHAFKFSNVKTIGFILPNVYKKHTRQKIIPSNWRISAIMDLGENCFTLNDVSYHIPSSFFIFDQSSGIDLRVNPFEYIDTPDFYFGNKDHFDIFVFGASPKHITFDPKPNNRGYYLKSKISVKHLVNKIQRINWCGNSCASGGVYWLTKHEFLEQYIKNYG